MRTASVERPLLYGIWAGLFLLLFLPLIITTDTIFPYIVGKAIYSRIIIDVLVGLWALLAFRSPSYRLPHSWLVVLFGVYVFVSLLAALFGVSVQRSLWSTYERMQGVVDIAHWFALTLVLVSVIRTTRNWYNVLNVNLAISLLVALIGMAQNFDLGAIPFYSFLEADERIGITLGNPAFVGSYMMVNVLIASGFLVQSMQRPPTATAVSPSRGRHRRRRVRRVRQEENHSISTALWRGFWIAAIVLELWVITLTGTRGAVIGLVAGLAVFAGGSIAFGQHWRVKVAASGVVVGIVALAVLAIALRDTPIVEKASSANIFVERLTTIAPEQDPFQSRLFTLSVGYHGFLDRPILGWGPENYLVAFGRYYTRDATSPEILDQAHNKPVEELVTKGVVGLVSYLSIWAFIVFIVVRRAKVQGVSDQTFTLTMAAALAAYFVQNLFLFDTPATTLLFILLLAVVANLESTFGEPVGESASEGAGERLWPALDGAKDRLLGKVAPLYSLIVRNGRGVITTTSLRFIALVAAFTLISVSMWMHGQALSSATIILGVSRGETGIDAVLATVEKSIETFPPLANYPRLILINNVGAIWANLSEEQSGRVMALAEREAAKAIEGEPENWRIHLAVVNMYRDVIRKSAEFDYLDAARPYLDRAAMLAPERKEIRDALQQFETMEIQRIQAREFRRRQGDN